MATHRDSASTDYIDVGLTKWILAEQTYTGGGGGKPTREAVPNRRGDAFRDVNPTKSVQYTQTTEGTRSFTVSVNSTNSKYCVGAGKAKAVSKAARRRPSHALIRLRRSCDIWFSDIWFSDIWASRRGLRSGPDIRTSLT